MFLFLFGFFKYLKGFLWVLVIPKWLIQASGWIAIFVENLWSFHTKTKRDPQTPHLLQNYFQKHEKLLKHLRNMLCKPGNLN